MKPFLLLTASLALLFLGLNAPAASGTVDFGNDNSARVINGQTTGPVSTNDHIRAALYWAPFGSDTFIQIGVTITNIGSPLPGLFAGHTCRTGTDTSGGKLAQFQVRAWGGGFATYEQATASNGVLVGHSAIIQVRTGDPGGDPPTAPGSLIAGGLQSFTLTPNSNPPSSLVLTCASNKTVDCASSWSFDAPSSLDTCGNTNVTLTILSTLTNGLCPQNITRTWQATDACGNTNSCTQTVTVVDTTGPVLTCVADKTVECASTWTFDAPSAFDTCSGTNVTVTILNTLSAGSCPQHITRTWLATDTCGNTSTCAQTVTVVDTTSPVLMCATNKTVECASAWTFDPPSASDTCSGTNVAVAILSTVSAGSCPQHITRTWLATDACGNTSTCSQTVTVVDTAPPVLMCATNKTVECASAWTFDPPSASDTCSGTNVTVTILDTVSVGSCPQSITRTWLATDACGNTNTCSQAVTVVDTASPVLACAADKTVDCASAWTFDAPSASDTCSGTNVAVTILSTVSVGVCPQNITRTWLATDACGNTNTCIQTVTVVDTASPVLACAADKTVDCASAWTFDAPSASDTCSGTNVAVTILSTVSVGVCPQNITRTWLATDACGNTNTCSQAVTVVDTSAPILSCGANKTVDCASTWGFDVPIVSDACGSTNLILTCDTVTNRLCPLVITRTWLAANACGYSNSCRQTVTVICTNCPVILVAKNCPAYPVPPGGTLVFTGTVTNASDATLTNVVVFNDKPAANTLVFGPAALEPGAGATFTGSYSVPGCACGPFADTLTASGTTPDGITFTNYATTACPGTNFGFPGDLNGDGIVDQDELKKVLAHYWPYSPGIYMTNPATLGGGRFQFELTNASAWNFSVLASTNMVDWTNLPGQAYPVYQFLDPDAGEETPFRFYRLRWP